MATFHDGEVHVQERAGVRTMAERVGRSIGAQMPFAAQEFLYAQSFVVVGGADESGRVWASLLSGEPGFALPLDETTVRVGTLPASVDPLHGIIRDGAPIGLIALEPATRRRMRLNGKVVVRDAEFLIRAEQVYSNCPKYIQKRELVYSESLPESNIVYRRGTTLSPEQKQFIETADTFFIASIGAENNADASHRGGNSGFVRVEGESKLVFPDYSGNAMFNTLGNIEVNPRSGLLFIDWESGETLQLSGRARVNWDKRHAQNFAGAERLVEFEIDEVVAIQGARRWNWKLIEASPFNPVSVN